MRSTEPAVRVHTDIRTIAKIHELRRALGITTPQAIGHLVMLWQWCLLNHPDSGMLPKTNGRLAEIMGYQGDPDLLYSALLDTRWIETGLLEGAFVHEWSLYTTDHQEEKRGKDRKRLARLRSEEQRALPKVDTDTAAIAGDTSLPEGIRVYAILRGPDTVVLISTLQLIEHQIARFPHIDAVGVALQYVTWQLGVAHSYRSGESRRKPHLDVIQGWTNQMDMHAAKGWSLRDPNASARTPTPMVPVSDEEIDRYHRGAKQNR